MSSSLSGALPDRGCCNSPSSQRSPASASPPLPVRAVRHSSLSRAGTRFWKTPRAQPAPFLSRTAPWALPCMGAACPQEATGVCSAFQALLSCRATTLELHTQQRGFPAKGAVSSGPWQHWPGSLPAPLSAVTLTLSCQTSAPALPQRLLFTLPTTH